jgi:hypothetical protein
MSYEDRRRIEKIYSFPSAALGKESEQEYLLGFKRKTKMEVVSEKILSTPTTILSYIQDFFANLLFAIKYVNSESFKKYGSSKIKNNF